MRIIKRLLGLNREPVKVIDESEDQPDEGLTSSVRFLEIERLRIQRDGAWEASLREQEHSKTRREHLRELLENQSRILDPMVKEVLGDFGVALFGEKVSVLVDHGDAEWFFSLEGDRGAGSTRVRLVGEVSGKSVPLRFEVTSYYSRYEPDRLEEGPGFREYTKGVSEEELVKVLKSIKP